MGQTACKDMDYSACKSSNRCHPVGKGYGNTGYGTYYCEETNGRMDDQMPDIANRFNHLDVERVLRAINGNMLDQDEIQE